MRIITWNVNGLRATVEAGAFAPIAELQPDTLCIQKVRTKIAGITSNADRYPISAQH